MTDTRIRLGQAMNMIRDCMGAAREIYTRDKDFPLFEYRDFCDAIGGMELDQLAAKYDEMVERVKAQS